VTGKNSAGVLLKCHKKTTRVLRKPAMDNAHREAQIDWYDKFTHLLRCSCCMWIVYGLGWLWSPSPPPPFPHLPRPWRPSPNPFAANTTVCINFQSIFLQVRLSETGTEMDTRLKQKNFTFYPVAHSKVATLCSLFIIVFFSLPFDRTPRPPPPQCWLSMPTYLTTSVSLVK
jgi:hypothetical protein